MVKLIKMRKIVLLVFICVSFAMAAPASADVWCTGKVDDLYIVNNGLLIISTTYRNDYTAICNVSSVWNEVPTSMCKSWQAILQTAQVTNRDITLAYDASVQSCSTIPTYGNSPAPIYVMIK